MNDPDEIRDDESHEHGDVAKGEEFREPDKQYEPNLLNTPPPIPPESQGQKKKKRSAWKYLWKLLEYASLAYFLFFHILIPFVFWFIMSQDPSLNMVEFNPETEKPSYYIDIYIDRITDDLKSLGFTPVLYLRNDPTIDERSVNYTILFENRQTTETAALTIMDRKGRNIDVMSANLIAFTTHYEGGNEITVDNRMGGYVYPAVPGRTVVHVPKYENPKDLYKIHQLVVAHLDPGLDKIIFGPGKALDFLYESNRRELEEQVGTGYMVYKKDKDIYKYSLKGIYMVFWKILWPGNMIMNWNEEWKTRKMLKEIGWNEG